MTEGVPGRKGFRQKKPDRDRVGLLVMSPFDDGHHRVSLQAASRNDVIGREALSNLIFAKWSSRNGVLVVDMNYGGVLRSPAWRFLIPPTTFRPVVLQLPPR